MKYTDALNLKPGDLVIIDNRNKLYGGLILEIESIKDYESHYCRGVTLKQPGFDRGFRIRDYDSRHIQRYEA